ncbi:MAG: hypothetical protein V1895_04040, partial [Parcubacteria group bacterium]
MKQADPSLLQGLRRAIAGVDIRAVTENVGTVVKVGDGIATIFGLQQVSSGEIVIFENSVAGLAINLEEDTLGVIILGEISGIAEGSTVK